MKVLLVLTVLMVSTTVTHAATTMSAQEKCVKITEMISKTAESQESIKNFLQEFDNMSGEEQKEVLTANTQRIYLRLKYFEKITSLKADAAVMKASGDILNDVIVGNVSSDKDAIEKLKAQLAPLNEQMLEVTKKYKESGSSCGN